MDLASLHPYVYYATQYPFSRGQKSRPRICYTSSLYLISEGKGVLHTCGRTHMTSPGSLVFIPAGQPHEWIADNEDPMVHVCCYFDWAYMDRTRLSSLPSPICYDFAELNCTYVGPMLPYPVKEHSQVESVRVWMDLFEAFYTVNDYTNDRSFIRSLKTQQQFQHFIQFFLSFILKKQNIPDPHLYKLLDRMEQDIIQGQQKPIAFYYQELGISRGYFFERFKKATGLSPVQYMNHFRISRTKEDLRSSQLTITEIAEKHHFSSVHYFSRLFQQLTGYSARAFRQRKNE